MNILEQILTKSIQDIICEDKGNAVELIIKTVFEGILKAERAGFLNESRNGNKANGFYERLARSINSYFNLRVPRDRLGLFKPVFLEVIKQQENQMMELAFKLYTTGLSTREIENILDEIFGKQFSASSVSLITKEFEIQRKAWLKRPLQESYYVIYSDALFIPVRRENVVREAFYIVMGLRTDLKREILGVYNIPVESAEGWREVIKDLKQRGLKKMLLWVADGLSGLEDVVGDEFPMAHLQKCLVHKMRNILLSVRTSDKEEIMKDFKNVFRLEDAKDTIEKAKLRLSVFLVKWGEKYSSLKNKFKPEHVRNYFAYLMFPASIQRMIYTTNWNERLNRSIRRTQNIRNSFPSPDSALNLICGCLMDFEKRVYDYPVSAFLKVQDELNVMMKIYYPQTQKT